MRKIGPRRASALIIDIGYLIVDNPTTRVSEEIRSIDDSLEEMAQDIWDREAETELLVDLMDRKDSREILERLCGYSEEMRLRITCRLIRAAKRHGITFE